MCQNLPALESCNVMGGYHAQNYEIKEYFFHHWQIHHLHQLEQLSTTQEEQKIRLSW